MYTFVSLFIYVVLNVFIAIIEEAFFFTTQRSMQVRAPTTDCVDSRPRSLTCTYCTSDPEQATGLGA